MGSTFLRRAIAAVSVTFVLVTSACSASNTPSPTPPYPPVATVPAPEFAQPGELFPQKGDVPQVRTQRKHLVCTDNSASLVLVIGNQPRTVERTGVRVTTERTDDGVAITFSPHNDTLWAGIVDGREVISLDNGDDGLFDAVSLRNDRFAPVDKHGDIDPEYRIGRVVLCNGGA